MQPSSGNGTRGVEADLGIARGGSVTPANPLNRREIAHAVEDIQRRANQLMNISAPHTLVERVIDKIAPSAARKEKARGDQELVRAEVDAQVTLHRTVKQAEVRRMAAFADAYGTACEVEAAREVAARGLDAASRVDSEIQQCGAAFDHSIDEAVRQASVLDSSTARYSAADRLERRIAMRGEVEELVMEGVREALRGTRKEP